MADNIRVFARFRPLVGRDLRLSSSARAAVFDVAGNTVTLRYKDNGSKPKSNREGPSFTFDSVFDAATTQEQLHESVGRVGVQHLLEGYNSTILTYGQTGSGKTFSMYGDESTCWRDWDNDTLPRDHGLVPRVTACLLDQVGELSAKNTEIEYAITCSFLEIYNEKIKDLFDPSTKKKIRVRDTKNEGVWVHGLTQETVTTKQDVADLLRLGFGLRSVGMTLMNERSSRSHCIFILNLHQNYPDGSSKVSKLNLVDLAGSERVDRSGVEGVAMKEAQNINKSLSCLGLCINALAEQGRHHIPYRDSSLTHLLKESLGGNAKTFLLIALSQCRIDAEETISTLRFGTRAKTVQNRAVVNVKKSNDELESQLRALRRYVAVLEGENKRLREHGPGSHGLEEAKVPSNGTDDQSPIGEVASNNSHPTAGGGASFVELDLECQALRHRVKSNQSTIAALKATFAVLLAKLTAAHRDVKELRNENQALELDLRVGRVNNASTAVAVAELESATRILKNREAEILRREKAIAEARVEVENESDQVRMAIKKQYELESAFRQRSNTLKQQMDEFQQHVQHKNREMLAAQERLDQAAAELLQLQASSSDRNHATGSSATLDVEMYKEQLREANQKIRRLSRQLTSLQQISDTRTALGTNSSELPDMRASLDTTKSVASAASANEVNGHEMQRMYDDSTRTEFPKLWEAAGKNIEPGALLSSDDTTKGLATIVEGLRIRRLQLQQQKTDLLSPSRSADNTSSDRIPRAISVATGSEREQWRRNLRSRGGAV